MAVLTSNKEISTAIKRSKANLPNVVTATEVRYVPSLDAFVLMLNNGTRSLFPREQLQGLESGTRKQLANVRLVGGGSGLHWPDLDADLLVEGLLNGVYGTRTWMSNLGRRGGSARSKAKSDAARRNGMKGGRPKVLAG